MLFRNLSPIGLALVVAVAAVSAAADNTPVVKPIRIVLIGDSTVASYAKPPEDRPDLTGWGQIFGEFFGDKVTMFNHAQSGRSSKSFIREGLWQKALAANGDYVFIQFGHNDSHMKDGKPAVDPATDFQSYLRQYIDESRAAGAKPILVTPVARRTFVEGKIHTILQPYADAMLKIGKEKDAPVIDLHSASMALFDRLGDEGSTNLTASASDRTHFSRKGALAIARLVAESLPSAVPELQSYLKAVPASTDNASARSKAAHAAEPTDWFHQARWGVMTHYLGAPPSSKGGAELTAEMWNKQVDAFDVRGLVEQLASTGAKYLLFTLGQNSGHYCSPNATYDQIVGITPSKCSRRDLVAELAKALAAHNIRLMVYLPSGAPAADPVARKALGWRWGKPGGWQLPGEPVGGRLAEFQRKWESIIREWSLRWGKSVSGWWIDGCYFADQMYRFEDEPNFASFARALKAGNPEAIVAFNPGVRVPVISHTKYEDYTAGEVNLPQLAKAIDACSGRWQACEGHEAQFHILTFLGKTWCRGDRPQLPDEQIVAYAQKIADKGGVITYDVPIEKSGLIPQPFVEQLRAMGGSIAVKAGH